MPKRDKLQPLQVYQLLPRTNCKKCGLPTCYAFAFALISREKAPADCPDLQAETFSNYRLKLEEAFGGTGEVQQTGLLIEKAKCNGCGDCVVVCNRALDTVVYQGAVANRGREKAEIPPVLKVIDGAVQVVNWTSCKRTLDPPNMCRVCEEKCLFGALELVR